jgi:23S rRNA-/tRNA-specific pseudouridylate synthase
MSSNHQSTSNSTNNTTIQQQPNTKRSRRYHQQQIQTGEQPTIEYIHRIDPISGLHIREVKPYVYKFESSCKKRWRGKTLLEVFQTEFTGRTVEYFIQAIRLGFITINGEQQVDQNHIVENGDIISHTLHRHEPSVLFVEAKKMIVSDDGDIIVINKPSTIPVHPSGAHHHTTALNILQREVLGGAILHTVHRLDRATSGLVLFTRSNERAREITSILSDPDNNNKCVRKIYVAKVRGKFPSTKEELSSLQHLQQELLQEQQNNTTTTTTTTSSDNDTPSLTFQEENSNVLFSYPVRVLNHKRGVHMCDLKQGKPSISIFLFIAHDSLSNTSIVRCQPLTGRTHQLRLHLQKLGFPIVNDSEYGNILLVDNKNLLHSTVTKNNNNDVKVAEAPEGGDEDNDDDDDGPILPGLTNLDQINNQMSIEEKIQITCGACHLTNNINAGELFENRFDELRKNCLNLHALQFQLLNPTNKTEIVNDWKVPLPEWCDGNLAGKLYV